MSDRREDEGDFYPMGKVAGGVPTEGFARLSDIPTLAGEEIQTNTTPKMRAAIEKIARKLGATVLLLLISVAVAYGERVQKGKFNEVDYDADPEFVADVDLSGLATQDTTDELARAIEPGTDFNVEPAATYDGALASTTVSARVEPGLACEPRTVVTVLTIEPVASAQVACPAEGLELVQFGQWQRGQSSFSVRQTEHGLCIVSSVDGYGVVIGEGKHFLVKRYEKLSATETRAEAFVDGYRADAGQVLTGMNGLNVAVGQSGFLDGMSVKTYVFDHALTDAEIVVFGNTADELPHAITEATLAEKTAATLKYTRDKEASLQRKVNEIKKTYATVETNAADIAELKAPKQTLLRTGQWIATYEPATSSSVVTNTTSTTVDNRILESKEVVAKTDGKATMKAMPISDDAYEVKLVSAESVNADAVVDGLNVSASTAGNYNPVIRVTAESGETKTCTVALSQSIETKKLGTVYTGDVAVTFRKKFNDVTLPYLASGEGDDYVERTAEGKTVYVGENSYFTTGGKAWNPNCYLPSSLTSFICFKTSASSYEQGQQSTNTGGGPAFVIGKRLVAGAHHWYASLNGVYTREIMRPNGTVVTVTTTGRGWNLAQWVKDNYGDAAEEVLGSLPTDYSDLDVYETTEDIPDDCVPYLLPFDVADDHFNVTNRTLEINYVNGYSLSQANCVYPVSMITDRGFSYGATNKCRKDIGDSWYKGHYWRVFQGDSSRPSFLIYNTSPIVVSLWSTYGHGPSLMRAVRALEALEQANGRTNSLKVLTAEQINTYISQ